MVALALLMSTLLSVTAASPVVVSRDAAPFSSTPRIVFSGNGCPSSTDSATFNGDWTNATINFDQFGLTTERRGSENCAGHFTGGGAPVGWQVALYESDLIGNVVLEKGTTFSWFTTTFWSDDAANTYTIKGSTKNTGDTMKNDVYVANKTPAEKLLWSKCVGPDGNIPGIFNINFRGAILGDNGGKFKFDRANLRFTWRQC